MSTNVLNPIRKNGHFYTCEEKDSGLSDEEQERKGPKKSSKAHENGYIQSGRTFCRNSKQLLRFQALKGGDLAFLSVHTRSLIRSRLPSFPWSGGVKGLPGIKQTIDFPSAV